MPGKIVTISIDGFHGTGVPVDLLASKLRHVQRWYEEIAKRSRPPGVSLSEAQRSGRLSAVRATAGSLVVEMRLAPAPWNDPERGLVDLSDRTVECSDHSLQAIAARDRAGLRAMFPSTADQAALLRAAHWLLPDVDADYGLIISGAGAPATLYGSHGEWVRGELESVEATDVERGDRTVVGTVAAIDTVRRPPRLLVRGDTKRVTACIFGEDVWTSVVDTAVGDVVEVVGRAALTKDGRVRALDPVTCIRQVQSGVRHVSQLTHGDRTFVLSSDLALEVSYRDGMVWRECPSLEIWACGETREAARRDFAEEFARVFDHYTARDDSQLDAGALALKRELLAIVQREERPGE